MSELTINYTRTVTWAQLERIIGQYAAMGYLLENLPAGQKHLLHDFERQKDQQTIEVDFIYDSHANENARRDALDHQREEYEEKLPYATIGEK